MGCRSPLCGLPRWSRLGRHAFLEAKSGSLRAGRILFVTLTFAVATPRLKDYGAILLLPAALFAVQNSFGRGLSPLLLALLFPIHTVIKPLQTGAALFHEYLLWFITLGLWIGFLTSGASVDPLGEDRVARAE